MKRTAIMLVIFGALFAGSPCARADSGNPFGFETNKHPLEYEYCKKEPGLYRGHGYTCSSAPRPHPDLDKYALKFVEGVGLCRISASRSEMLYSDVENMIEMSKDQLAKKYGPPAIPTEEEARDNIVLQYYWAPKGGFNGLGDVKYIRMRAKDFSLDLNDLNKNWVTIDFWLVTSDACQKKIDDKADRAF